MFNASVARYYLARGADEVIIDDALSQADELSVAATRSTIRWAAALSGKASMPVAFRPDRRLRSPEARAVALELIDRRLAVSDDAELHRHRSYLLGDQGPDDPTVRRFVERELNERLAAAAVAVPKRNALDTRAAFDLLGRLQDALDAAGIRTFLVSGTLLGVIREGQLLPHDYDLDLGVLPGDTSADSVADALGSLDDLTFEVEEWRVWGRDGGGVAFDVFIHYEERGRWWHATRTHAWWNTPFELVPIDVNGRSFWVPADADRYLEENYGEWRTPAAFYHKSFDTPNREYCRSVEGLLYLYELVLDAMRRRDRFVAESAARELAENFGIDVRYHFAPSALLDADADVTRR